MLNQVKIIGSTLTYLALMMVAEIIDFVYPDIEKIALSKRISCGS